MVTTKQAGASRPGEPHPPPKWQPDTDMQLNRDQKHVSSLATQLREVMVGGRAASAELVGKLGNVTEKLNEITARLSFLEQKQSESRTGGSSRPVSTNRRRQEKSPVFFAGETTGLVSAAGGAVCDVFAQPPVWPPPSVSATVTSSPFKLGPRATGAAKIATVPFEELVPTPQLDPKSETDEDEGHCHFSDGVEEDEEEPEPAEDVLQVSTRPDSGGTTPTKPRPVPVPNVRACSKSSPRKIKIKRLKSPSGDTPGREAVVRQNAVDLMDEEIQRWAVAAEPRKELCFV